MIVMEISQAMKAYLNDMGEISSNFYVPQKRGVFFVGFHTYQNLLFWWYNLNKLHVPHQFSIYLLKGFAFSV